MLVQLQPDTHPLSLLSPIRMYPLTIHAFPIPGTGVCEDSINLPLQTLDLRIR